MPPLDPSYAALTTRLCPTDLLARQPSLSNHSVPIDPLQQSHPNPELLSALVPSLISSTTTHQPNLFPTSTHQLNIITTTTHQITATPSIMLQQNITPSTTLQHIILPSTTFDPTIRMSSNPIERHMSAPYPSSHRKLKEYKCPVPGCSSVFGRMYGLKSHMVTHSNARPHVCPHGCGAAFGRRHDLTRHLRTLHSESRPFKCPYPTCRQTLKKETAFTKHLSECHPETAHEHSDLIEAARKRVLAEQPDLAVSAEAAGKPSHAKKSNPFPNPHSKHPSINVVDESSWKITDTPVQTQDDNLLQIPEMWQGFDDNRSDYSTESCPTNFPTDPLSLFHSPLFDPFIHHEPYSLSQNAPHFSLSQDSSCLNDWLLNIPPPNPNLLGPKLHTRGHSRSGSFSGYSTTSSIHENDPLLQTDSFPLLDNIQIYPDLTPLSTPFHIDNSSSVDWNDIRLNPNPPSNYASSVTSSHSVESLSSASVRSLSQLGARLPSDLNDFVDGFEKWNPTFSAPHVSLPTTTGQLLAATPAQNAGRAIPFDMKPSKHVDPPWEDEPVDDTVQAFSTYSKKLEHAIQQQLSIDSSKTIQPNSKSAIGLQEQLKQQSLLYNVELYDPNSTVQPSSQQGRQLQQQAQEIKRASQSTGANILLDLPTPQNTSDLVSSFLQSPTQPLTALKLQSKPSSSSLSNMYSFT